MPKVSESGLRLDWGAGDFARPTALSILWGQSAYQRESRGPVGDLLAERARWAEGVYSWRERLKEEAGGWNTGWRDELA